MSSEQTIIQVSGEKPTNLFLLPLFSLVPMPGMVLPLTVKPGQAQETFAKALEAGDYIGLFYAKSTEDDPRVETVQADDLSEVGVIGRIVRRIKLPDGDWTVLIHCLGRIGIEKMIHERHLLFARVHYIEDSHKASKRIAALARNLGNLVNQYLKSASNISEEISVSLMNIQEPGALADFIGAHFPLSNEERLELLLALNVQQRLEKVSVILLKEIELAKLGTRINEDLKSKIEERQKEFMLREQLKIIRKELGEEKDEKEALREKYEQKIIELEIPEDTATVIRDELKRMSLMMPESSEFHVIRSYLDWLTQLPWNIHTEDQLDLSHAEQQLDKDHFGLEDVKERIIEFLAVRKMNPARKGTILCFAGPPGVGKTSLGQSIATSMGRKFYRFSLGGMRDEAEIKGHRRTYIGAMPGKFIQALKTVQTKNPVILLDEIDKVGSDWRGDPSSALLEVLDPAQNGQFIDNYLDVPFDLSEVVFIATANVLETVPRPLLDRMEVVRLPGYLPEEKVEIATKYLLPRQLKEHGLLKKHLKVSRRMLSHIASQYTREAGVRQLNRELGRLCRKVAVQQVKRRKQLALSLKDEKSLTKLLGPPKISDDIIHQVTHPGLSLGLAWTATGGSVLLIEVSQMPGTGKLTLTGQLGKVMNESANIALSYVRAHWKELGLKNPPDKTHDLHIHFPAGAVPKDGPSAGITIVTALVSLLRGKVIKRGVAMTGEVTLTGRVLPVGGLREKIVAARRFGLKTVIVPAANRKDIAELKPPVKKGLKIVFADTYTDVLSEVLR